MMSRWIGTVGMVLVVIGVAGCGGSVKELPPSKEAAPAGNIGGDPKERAMKGMPEEMRKKYEAQKKK
jgi:hypothetical protein